MRKAKTILFCTALEMVLIACVAFANRSLNPLHYFFWYNLLYGMVFSFLFPLFLLRRENNILCLIGLIPLRRKQIAVLILFDIFSVGGQLLPIAATGKAIPWHLLPAGVVPLIMTTFFEEFLFRGFIQNRFEKVFGTFPAILVSGLAFSLYHTGYPGFRTFGDILLLSAVGVMFAGAYRLSGNNLTVAYFVNLPNAFATYMLKFEQFPVMTASSTAAGIITLCMITAVFILLLRKTPRLPIEPAAKI